MEDIHKCPKCQSIMHKNESESIEPIYKISTCTNSTSSYAHPIGTIIKKGIPYICPNCNHKMSFLS